MVHTQNRLAQTILNEQGDYVFPVKENQLNLYKNMQSLFPPEYPKPGFGKIHTNFHQAQKVNKGGMDGSKTNFDDQRNAQCLCCLARIGISLPSGV